VERKVQAQKLVALPHEAFSFAMHIVIVPSLTSALPLRFGACMPWLAAGNGAGVETTWSLVLTDPLYLGCG
jgi:hypothetical protein